MSEQCGCGRVSNGAMSELDVRQDIINVRILVDEMGLVLRGAIVNGIGVVTGFVCIDSMFKRLATSRPSESIVQVWKFESGKVLGREGG